MVLIPLAVLVVAVVFLALGLRGRRIDDHPLCRRCRFDLVGHGDAATRCPECGADLTAPRALRTGNRRRRRGYVGWGVAAIVLALLAGGALIADAAGKRRWNSMKPTWLLRYESSVGATSGAVAAATELLARFGDGRLDKGALKALAERGLAIQADPAARWDLVWGDAIEAAIGADLLTSEQQSSFARHAVDFVFAVRARTQRGQPCAMHPGYVTARAGSKRSFDVTAALTGFMLDGRPVEHSDLDTGPETLSPNSGSTVGRASPLIAEAGPHRLRTVWRRTARITGSTQEPVAWEEVVERDVEISDTPVVRLVPDDSLQPAVQKALSAAGLTVTVSGQGPPSLWGILTLRDPPRDLAFEVLLREVGSEREWRVASITAAQSRPGKATKTSHGLSAALPGYRGGPVDVILRPSLAAALRTTNLTEVWEGQIVLPGQPVTVNGDLGPP